MFINVYRLLMTYSLIKPPRGSNVTGGQVMEALLDLKDLKGETDAARRKELLDRIDELLDSDLDIPESMEMDMTDCLSINIDEEALALFGGYVARKVRAMKPASECRVCQDALLQHGPLLDRESLLDLRSRGGLLRPSTPLHDLLIKAIKIKIIFNN